MLYGSPMSFTKTESYASLRRPVLKTVASCRVEAIRLATLIDDVQLAAEAIAVITAEYDGMTVDLAGFRCPYYSCQFVESQYCNFFFAKKITL